MAMIMEISKEDNYYLYLKATTDEDDDYALTRLELMVKMIGKMFRQNRRCLEKNK